MTRDMTQGNITGHMLSYAVPLVFGNLFQQLYHTVDSVVVGQFNGKEALAAIGSAGPVMNILIFLIVGISMGSSILMAEYFGAKDYESLRKEMATSLTAGFLLTAVLTVLGILFAQPLVTLFADGYDPQTAELAASLTRVMFPTVLFTGVAFSFVGVLQSLGEFNVPALISVVSFRKSLPHYCLPKFSQDACIHLEGLYHPLLNEPVLNDVVMHRNSIVTGSNASGKSTFIKAVTVNCILAQTIHTCMAGIAEIPHAYVATSMAVKDSLMEGESYYMKEIRSLNRMLGYMQENELVVCAIDEILRGTNTKERIAASAAILRYLEERNCLVLVASHDMELVDLLDREYEHYYFCEQEGEEDIVFDYKIHKGINEKTNAIRLLEYVGFPGQIVSDAERIYQMLASE